ncbi:POLS2 protein, partial [Alopecoenas beccarii]|nr:POLS2 protein [Alopecoenas beccarii]
ALAAILVHPGFRGVAGGHDLALLRLAEPLWVGPGTGVAPVCLPRPRHALPFGATCWVTGWGHVAENGEGHPDAWVLGGGRGPTRA